MALRHDPWHLRLLEKYQIRFYIVDMYKSFFPFPLPFFPLQLSQRTRTETIATRAKKAGKPITFALSVHDVNA